MADTQSVKEMADIQLVDEVIDNKVEEELVNDRKEEKIVDKQVEEDIVDKSLKELKMVDNQVEEDIVDNPLEEETVEANQWDDCSDCLNKIRTKTETVKNNETRANNISLVDEASANEFYYQVPYCMKETEVDGNRISPYTMTVIAEDLEDEYEEFGRPRLMDVIFEESEEEECDDNNFYLMAANHRESWVNEYVETACSDSRQAPASAKGCLTEVIDESKISPKESLKHAHTIIIITDTSGYDHEYEKIDFCISKQLTAASDIPNASEKEASNSTFIIETTIVHNCTSTLSMT